MGRKRQGPSPSVPERNRQFARHLNRLLSDASLDPSELAALLGRTEVLIYKYLQGVHLPRLHDLPELARALNLKSCRDLIPQECKVSVNPSPVLGRSFTQAPLRANLRLLDSSPLGRDALVELRGVRCGDLFLAAPCAAFLPAEVPR